jgi:hypothetical protein
MRASVTASRKEMTVYQKGGQVYPERREENPEEMKSVAEHEKLPEEVIAVNSLGALK